MLNLFTVGGTGELGPVDPGQFPVQVAERLIPSGEQIFADKLDGLATTHLINWMPIDYPAAVLPMGPSVQTGRSNLVQFIQSNPGPFVLSGYSQGAMVTDFVWAYDILAPSGVLHDRINDCQAVFNFGDPMRSPGIANGNTLVGIPLPKTLDGVVTGGIAGPGCLTAAQTPSHFYSIALDGDLYAAAPVGINPWTAEGQAGAVETGIFNLIQQPTFWNIIAIPFDILVPIGVVEAIINGVSFAVAGPSAPHWQYGPYVPAVANYIANLATKFL
jgi:hypothetical protein